MNSFIEGPPFSAIHLRLLWMSGGNRIVHGRIISFWGAGDGT